MNAWQLLLDWLAPEEWARLTLTAVGLRREVQWVKPGILTETLRDATTNYLYDYKITIFSMTPERYISFLLGWGGGWGS